MHAGAELLGLVPQALMRFAKANPTSVPAAFALGPDAYWSSSRSDAGHYFLVLVTSDPSATYGANPENENRLQLRPIRAF